MGLFDTVEAEVTCTECGLEAIRQIQFKHPGHRMETYEIGDLVQGAPAGRPLLETSFTCPGPGGPEDQEEEEEDATPPDGQGEEENAEDHATQAGPDPGSNGATHRVPCWIHIDRGFLTDVTTTRPDRPSPFEFWMAEQAGWNAQEAERILRGIEATVRNRRETIQAQQAGTLPPEDEAEPLLEMHRIRSEQALLDRLEAKLEHRKTRRWPSQR